MKITVVGAGYVGLSIASTLCLSNKVVLYDINENKVNQINNKICPIRDDYMSKFFASEKMNLTASTDYKMAFLNSKFIIICTPTDYDETINYFDTSSVEETIEKIKEYNNKAIIIIKSTVPFGFTKRMQIKYTSLDILFSPEFLREGNALYDSLYPSRIIISPKNEKAEIFGNVLKRCVLKKNVVIKYMNTLEAEAVKLFSNSYLALRIAFFNELDSFAEANNLNTKDIIDGVSLDQRIGDFYNNPSFGYGGYCLPKDTKQLKSNFNGIPEKIITAIVESNQTRKMYVANKILSKEPKVVGIYRLNMKSNSDNYRSSAVIDIINFLKKSNIKVIIFEPTYNGIVFNDCMVIKSLEYFKKRCDLIVANRFDTTLCDVKNKVYTRDIFCRD